MAIFQVVDQDGQKVLVEVPVGSDDIWGRYVPGAVPDNPAALIADLPVGAYVTDDKQLPARSVPAPYNMEEWITESGTWTAPVTGWYDILLIAGGDGAIISSGGIAGQGGKSGNELNLLKYYAVGQTVSVTIGAAGLGDVYTGSISGVHIGGDTSWGDISTVSAHNNTPSIPMMDTLAKDYDIFCPGSGKGGAVYGVAGLTGKLSEGRAYGAGGAGVQPRASNSSYTRSAGNGAPGAICIRYYDPNKENN